MKFAFPADTRLYCRGCERVVTHNEVAGRVTCRNCERTIETAELVAVYATDTDGPVGEFLFPLHALSPVAYVTKLGLLDDPDV